MMKWTNIGDIICTIWHNYYRFKDNTMRGAAQMNGAIWAIEVTVKS